MFKRQRILLIINSGLLNSGVPKIVTNIVSGLHSEFDFDIVVQSKHKEYFDSFLINKGCKIFYMGKIPSGRWGILYHLTIWPIKLCWILITRRKYNCVHSFTAYQSGIDCCVAKLCGIKKRISNTHGTVSSDKTIIVGLYQKICKLLIKKFSTERIGVSKQAAKSIYNKMDYKVIYNGIPFFELNKIQKKEHSGLNFLQIGYFNSNKNQLFSLSIIKKLIDKGVKCHFFLIGFNNDVGYYKKVINYIRDNSLCSYITIFPHDYDKNDLYPVIDFLLLPSFKEGLSLVALECQSANIKCIVSDNVPEEVDIGLLHRVSLNSIDNWINTIELLMNVHEHVLIHRAMLFSEDKFNDEFYQIYKQ